MKLGLTLTEMAAELERQNEAKVDYLAPSDRIHFVSGENGSEIDLMGTDAEALSVLENAHGQIATKLGIPKRYYDRLRVDVPTLLDENVNRLLRFRPDDSKPFPKWMVRTLDGNARACLSDAYRDIDNFDIAGVVLPILGELPGVEIKSCALTETHMHIKAVTSIEDEVRGSKQVGDVVRAGVYLGNSEVGRGKLVVYPFVERLICTNGMVSTAKGEGMMDQIHLGRRHEIGDGGRIFRDATRKADDHAFILAIGDVVRAAVDEARFHELVAEMSQAAASAEVRNVAAAVEVLAKNEGLSEGESSGILQHLAAGGDLSQWGMLNAVTRHAEDVESYDRATELETIGGKILAYGPRDWARVAEAVAS